MIHNLIDKVKLAFQKEKQLPNALYEILGFYPHQLEIYRIALSHKSRAYRGKTGKALNNERLEYLGDAILEAVVSDIVFHRYPSKPEGFLTSTRSKIVQRSTLNRLAEKLGIDRLIQRSASTRSHNSCIGGNAFEALVGAIYLDRGYAHCKWFIEKRILGRLVDIDGLAHQEVNFKSKLLEWTQKNRIQADYQMSELEPADANSPLFRSAVVIEGIVIGDGKGYSKKESQQASARTALTRLRREPQLIDRIFRAKEKRTAMEADEVCDLPHIDEIEEEIRQNRPRASRHAKPAPGRSADAGQAVARKPAAQPDEAKRPGRQPDNSKNDDARQAETGRQRAVRQDNAAPTGKTDAGAATQLRLTRQATPKTEALPRPEQLLSLPRNEKAGAPETAAAQEKSGPGRTSRSRQTAAQPDDAQTDASPAAQASITAAATDDALTDNNAAPAADNAAGKAESAGKAAPAAQGKSRNSRSRRGRQKTADGAPDKPETDDEAAAAQSKPRRERSRRNRRNADETPEAQSAADNPAGKEQNAPAGDAERPARRQRRSRQRRDDDGNDDARREEIARREAIISQAEEAAWAEHAD